MSSSQDQPLLAKGYSAEEVIQIKKKTSRKNTDVDKKNNNNPTASISQSFAQKTNLQKRSMFQAPFEDTIVLQHEIQDAKENYGSFMGQIEDLDINKDDFIQDRKMSMVQERKSTNIQCILAITNTMVGSVALCLPYNFWAGGIVAGLIVMVLMGVLSYFTCYIIVQNQQQGDTDLAQIINRTIGKKWGQLFCVCSSLLLFIASIVYFMLQNQVCYAFLKFVFAQAGQENYLPDISSITFDRFSVQYQCIILAVPIFIIISMKQLSLIIKLGQFGVLAILIYGVFILYIFIDNLASKDFKFNWDTKMKFFPKDFSDIANITGNFSLAFFIHNGVTTILANAEQPKSNGKNLFFGYLNVGIVYGFVGLLGSIGILNLDISNPDQQVQTVMQLFPAKQIFPAIVNLLFLFQLSTALPILVFISRSQFFNLIYGQNNTYPEIYNVIYNAVFMLSAVGVQIAAINPSVLIGMDGAICGFYMVYLIPFLMRMRTYNNVRGYYPLNKQFSKSVSYSEMDGNNINDPLSTIEHNNNKQSLSKTSSYEKNQPEETQVFKYEKLPFYEYLIWGIIISIGVAMGGLQIAGLI